MATEAEAVAAGPGAVVVFIERLDRHRLTDKWVEFPVTGVFEVREGRITDWRYYFDAAIIPS
jgi:limonene-1,2-epoxide hydrolase